MAKSETSSRTRQSRWSATRPYHRKVAAARLPENQSRGWHLSFAAVPRQTGIGTSAADPADSRIKSARLHLYERRSRCKRYGKAAEALAAAWRLVVRLYLDDRAATAASRRGSHW